MLKTVDTQVALSDVTTALFELGVLDSVSEDIDLEKTLRNDLGLDSQEMVSLVDIAQSLASSRDPVDEGAFETVQDVVSYLAINRASWLPTDVPFVLQGATVINQSLETVFGYIANYRVWPEILDHVTKVETDYDDGKHQSFKMHIEELGTKRNYYVQSWRYVNYDSLIVDFSQPKPPKGFAVHKGGWRFRVLGSDRTELISYHGFSLEEGADADGSLELIRKHIHAALKTWARHGNGCADG